MILLFLLLSNWYMYKHDCMRTGFSQSKGVLDSIKLRWVYTAGTAGISYSSPAIADIDLDGRKEVAIGALDSCLYVLKADSGHFFWKYKTGSYIWSSPCIVNLDNIGGMEIVFGSDSIYALRCNGVKYWSYPVGGQIISSPIAKDIDSDGNVEILIGSTDGKLYVLRSNGSYYWSFNTGAPIEASPAFGDANIPIVIASTNGILYLLSPTGTLLNMYTAGAGIKSTTALGDLNSDGILDIIFGCMDNYVYAIDGASFNEIWTYPTGDMIDYQSPSLADIDGDTKLEIVIGSYDEKVHCIEHNGVQKWSVNVGITPMKIPAAVSIADINTDGELEIVGGTHEGHCYALNPDGSELWLYGFIGDAHATPAIADIDNDDSVEVVIASLLSKVYALDFPDTIVGGPYVKESSKVSLPNYSNNLIIFNLLGQKIFDPVLNSGIYFIKSSNCPYTRKIIIIK